MTIIKVNLLLALIAFSMNSFAALPREVKNLLNKDGEFISMVNGKNVNGEAGTDCRIIMNPYGGDESISIESVAYFTPVAHMDNAKKEIKDGVTLFVLDDSGLRPGGSVGCGNTPQLSYKKTVEVRGSTLIIKQKFRCLLERSTEIIQGCKIK